ncbi:replication initiation protein [Tranquillimonas rosea]|uniref:replication initiation protein n=1 Tax=Tranquillimonas rosea TaxID=641238 RepID=UPI003BAD6822
MNQAPAQMTGPLSRGSVKKNVAAIHISGKLTLLQRKMSNVLLLNAYDTLVTKDRHRIDAKILSEMVDFRSNDTAQLKQALRSLTETVAEWNMLDDKGREEWGVSSLLAHAKLKDGVCEYSYSPALAEKLHDPKVYSLINLDIQRRFNSGHALALYENCYRFVKTKSTGWWEIDIFRRLMGVDDKPYYDSYKQLNAKIIKPAVAEVNQTSNIIITPETRKMGRQITEIRFKIEENPQLAMIDIDDGKGQRKGEVYGRLRDMGVSDRLALQWIAQHGEPFVAEKISYVAGQGDVKNQVGYLTAALREDYKAADEAAPAAPTAEALEAAERRRAAEAEEQARLAARETEIDTARRARAARMERIREVAQSRSPTQRDADKRLFAARLETEVERSEFARLGWGSGLCASAMVAFWEEMVPGIFDDLEGQEG